MQRYEVVDNNRLYMLRLTLKNRQSPDDIKTFDITNGDMVSILYIDKLSEIGEEKEYVVDGKVNAINMRNNPKCEKCKEYAFHYQIIIDSSKEYGSKLVYIDPHNILDINKYPYTYDLIEDPTIIPSALKEGFFVHEIVDDTKHDISVPNDPLLGNADEEGE